MTADGRPICGVACVCTRNPNHRGHHGGFRVAPTDPVDDVIRELARDTLATYDRLRDAGWVMEPMSHEAEVRARLEQAP